MSPRTRNSSRPHNAVAGIAAVLMAVTTLFAVTGDAIAGKGGNDRAPAPRAAAPTSARVSPFIDVADQVRAQTGVKTDKPCNKRHCNYWPPHQH